MVRSGPAASFPFSRSRLGRRARACDSTGGHIEGRFAVDGLSAASGVEEVSPVLVEFAVGRLRATGDLMAVFTLHQSAMLSPRSPTSAFTCSHSSDISDVQICVSLCLSCCRLADYQSLQADRKDQFFAQLLHVDQRLTAVRAAASFTRKKFQCARVGLVTDLVGLPDESDRNRFSPC